MNKANLKEPFNRDKQHAAKRQAVILAAAGAFTKRGYHNTSMLEIANTLGLSKAALYYYVTSKEEILYESHLMAYASMDNILDQARAVGGSGLEQLCAIFREFVTMLTQSGVSLLTDVDSLQGAWRDDVRARRDAIEKQVMRLVKLGQKDGTIEQGDPSLQMFFFMGALNWLNAWYEPNGRLSGEHIADHFTNQLCRGISSNPVK